LTQISINLLGIEQKEALSRKGIPFDKGWLIAIACILVSGLLLFVADFVLAGMVANAEETKAANEAKIVELDKKIAEIKTLELERTNLQMEEKILRYVTGENYKWSYFLQEIRALMPIDASINDLKIGPAGDFTLTGIATDHRTVALYLASLQNSKLLKEVVLQSSVKDTKSTTFVITCKKAN
jgi:Tfp pilus assembly protein PilN